MSAFKSRKKPGEEPQAAREPRVGHPCARPWQRRKKGRADESRTALAMSAHPLYNEQRSSAFFLRRASNDRANR